MKQSSQALPSSFKVCLFVKKWWACFKASVEVLQTLVLGHLLLESGCLVKLALKTFVALVFTYNLIRNFIQTPNHCELWILVACLTRDSWYMDFNPPNPIVSQLGWRECRAVFKPRFNPCDLIDRRSLVATELSRTYGKGAKKLRKSRTSSHTLRVYPTSQTHPAKQIWIFLFVGISLGYTKTHEQNINPIFGIPKLYEQIITSIDWHTFRIHPNTFKWRLTDHVSIWLFFQLAVFWGEKSWISKFRNSQS